jgi:hypothetical protein
MCAITVASAPNLATDIMGKTDWATTHLASHNSLPHAIKAEKENSYQNNKSCLSCMGDLLAAVVSDMALSMLADRTIKIWNYA